MILNTVSMTVETTIKSQLSATVDEGISKQSPDGLARRVRNGCSSPLQRFILPTMEERTRLLMPLAFNLPA